MSVTAKLSQNGSVKASGNSARMLVMLVVSSGLVRSFIAEAIACRGDNPSRLP